MHKKFLVITANLGKKDKLVDPPKSHPNCDYIAITDTGSSTNIWKLSKPFIFSEIDKYTHRRNAKIYKVLSTLLFSQYEYIIWQDGNHQLKVDPSLILDEYGEFDLLLFNHPHRQCAYDEMGVIYGLNLDEHPNIKNQYTHYTEQGFPKNYGLYEMTTFIKKNTPENVSLDLMWWEQICKFSSRDQCSFTYCLWKMENKLNIKTFKGHANLYAGGNKYFSEQEGHLSNADHT